MSGRAWYKRYPSDYLHATMPLNLPQKGAYGVALDLMYEHGGPIADDPKWLARVCGCSIQQWRKIRQELIDIGKLTITEDGRLSNGRMMREMLKQRGEGDVLSAAGRRGGTRTQAQKRAKTPQKPLNSTISPQDAHPFAPSNSPASQIHGVFDPDHMKNNDIDDDGLDFDTYDAFCAQNEKPINKHANFVEENIEDFGPKSSDINEVTSQTRQADSETQKERSLVPSTECTIIPGSPTSTARTRANARAVERSDRGTRIPVDWTPSELDCAYAARHNVDPSLATEDMLNYWQGVPGKAALKLDWSRTYRNRVLTLADQGRFTLRKAAYADRNGLRTSNVEQGRQAWGAPTFLAPDLDQEPMPSVLGEGVL